MEFTKEEIAMMQNNVRQIEQFIATEIIPFTREWFQIGWGGTYRAPMSWDEGVPVYHIGVYDKEKVAAYGKKYGPNKTFIMSKEAFEKVKGHYPFDTTGYTASCIYDDPYAMHEIITNWKTIKTQLLNHIVEQKKKIEAITSFAI